MARAYERLDKVTEPNLLPSFGGYSIIASIRSTARQLSMAKAILGHGMKIAAKKKREDAAIELASATYTIESTLKQIRARVEYEKNHEHIDQRMLYQELLAVDREFESLMIDFNSGEVIARTEPITLEDGNDNSVDLGEFGIAISWARIAEGKFDKALRIIAYQPNPSVEDYVHPHVHTGLLCTGDATIPFSKALQRGSLLDAFFLVRSVLTNYYGESAYAYIENWDRELQSCGCCEIGIGSEDSAFCESCNTDVCDGCYTGCDVCEDGMCVSCAGSEKCHGCNNSMCSRCCSNYCRGCRHSFCEDCTTRCTVCDETVCDKCGSELSRRDDDGDVKIVCKRCYTDCSECHAVVLEKELDANGKCPNCGDAAFAAPEEAIHVIEGFQRADDAIERVIDEILEEDQTEPEGSGPLHESILAEAIAADDQPSSDLTVSDEETASSSLANIWDDDNSLVRDVYGDDALIQPDPRTP